MNLGIPITTDNIFKFYALFGLAILIASIGGHLYLSSLEYSAYVSALRARAEVLAPTKMGEAVDSKQVAASIANKIIVEVTAELNHAPRLGCWVLTFISILLSAHGFRRWHTEIQPKLDERERLENEHLRSQIAKNLAEARRAEA